MRTRGLVFAVLALLIATGSALAKPPKPKNQLKIATLAPEGSTWMNLMHEMDERVREATGNEVGFKFYAGGVQGDERLVLRKMRNGQLHGGGFTGNGLGAVAPALRVLEIPFLVNSEDEIEHLYDEFGSEFEELLAESGHVLLGWAEVGFIHTFTQRDITSLDDLQKIKMWLWEGDPLPEAFFEEAGVSPVPLAITDVYTSLQTGLVDGVYSSPYACVVLQWHTQVAAMSEAPITYAIGAVIVTQKAWKKISPAAQAKVKEIADEIFERLQVSSREENRSAVADIEAAGLRIVPIANSDMAVFREIGARAARKGVGTLYSEDLLDRVQAAMQEYRSASGAGVEE